ncbi:MAG: T9SS type A sorting domain-containing protein [Bacteroidota bacterium]|nr:T9SS type A sorting domain-containing protein [Bacteroidota bacterium]
MKTIHKSLFVITTLVFTIVFNSYAQSTFARTYYTNDTSLFAKSMVKSFDNKYLICGNINESHSFYVMIDSLGNSICSKTINAKGSFSDVISTNDSCFVFAGHIYNDIDSTDNFFCMKISDNGNIIWSKEIDFGSDESVNSIQQTIDNGFILAGYSEYYPYSARGKSIIVKLDSVGNIDWCRRDSISNYHCATLSVTQANDSGFIAVGSMMDPQIGGNSTRFYVMRLNFDGAIAWFKRDNNLEGYKSKASDVVTTATGFTIFAEMEIPYNNMVLIHTDFSGNISQVINWQHYTYWSSIKYPNKIKKLHNNDLILVTPSGLSPIVNTQNTVFEYQYFFDGVADCAITDDGGFFVLGSGPIIYLKDVEDAIHFGIIKTDSTGYSDFCYEWTESFPIDTIDINLTDVSSFESNMYYIRNQPFQIIDFTLQDYDGCVGYTGSIENESDISSPFTIFPNPSDGIFQIKFSSDIKKQRLDIYVYNSLGQKIFSGHSGNNFQIDLRNQPDGIYFTRIIYGNNEWSQIIIKKY